MGIIDNQSGCDLTTPHTAFDQAMARVLKLLHCRM